MKLFGHPIHPLVVHFPTALLPMDLALSLLYNYTDEISFAHAGFYCLIGGTAAGLLTMATGLVDLLSIPRSNKAAFGLALYHGFINGMVILVYLALAFKSWKLYPEPYFFDATGIGLKSFLVITLFAGNYLGGKLIYSHLVGIDKQKDHGKNL